MVVPFFYFCNMNITYQTQKALPLPQILHLYNAHNWTAYTKAPQQLQKAIENSHFVLTAWDQEMLVGLARAISDDVSIFYLQDIIVLPTYEGKGIGQTLIKKCLERYEHVRQKVLMTDDNERVLRFYEKVGYTNLKEKGELNVFVF